MNLAFWFRTAAVVIVPGVAIAAVGTAAATATAPFDGPPTIPSVHYVATGLRLSEWNIVGPFSVAPTESPWSEDLSAQYSYPEATLSRERFESFCAAAGRHGPGAATDTPHFYRQAGTEFIDFQNLFSRPYVVDPRPGAAYVACLIQADAAQRAYLLLGSSDGNKIWLNGELVGGQAVKRGVNRYDDAYPVSLKRGENLLIIKVCRWGLSWGLTVRIEPTAEAAAATALAGQGMLQGLLLKHSVVAEGAPLHFQPRGVPVGVRFPAAITRVSGQLVTERVLTSGEATTIAGLTKGIYRLTIRAGRTSYTESFCVGEPSAQADELSAMAVRFSRDQRTANNLDALTRRMAILDAPENQKFSSEGNQYAWERKVSYTLDELELVVHRLRHGEEAFAGVPGLHLRAFQSAIDGQPQHYRIFIPSSYHTDSPGLPLVVMLPTVLSATRPFIASPFVAAHSEAERIGAIAERLGVAVLWSGYRNRPTGSPSETTHVDEAIAAVTADYRIDPKRITLLGSCSGGALATSQVVHSPNQFAGIALLNPMFMLSRFATADPANEFYRSPAFRQWPALTDATTLFFPLPANPVYIIHDGAEPGHGDLATSVDFVRRAVGPGHAVAMQQRIQTLGQHFGAWDELLTWCAQQINPTPSDRHSDAFYLRSDGEPSCALVVARRFVVVTGTGGSDGPKINAIADAFQQAWTRNHFGSCRVVSDRDFDPKVFGDANLVLIGNAKTNSAWAAFAAKSPFRIETRYGADVMARSDLSFQAAFKHPDDSSRYVLLIGAANLAGARFGTQNLSIDGWYNLALWRTVGESVELLETR